MVRVRILLLWVMVALFIPLAAHAQTEDPCGQFAVGSPEWDQCIDQMVLANRQAGQRMTLIAGTAALLVVGLLVVGSTALSRRRMANVAAGDMRAVLRAMVPPEAGSVSDEMLDRAVKQATTIPTGYQWLVIAMFVGVAAFFLTYQLSGFGALTMVVLVIFLGFVFVMAALTPLRMRRAAGSADAWLTVLGLKIVALPSVGVAPRVGGGMQTRVTGPSVTGGTRYGRAVEISFGLTAMGAPTVSTHVVTPVSQPFEVSGSDANWQSGALPSGALSALQRFAPLDRRVRVRGGADGIWVERQRRSTEAASARGTVQWLRDLQLAESLADALR